MSGCPRIRGTIKSWLKRSRSAPAASLSLPKILCIPWGMSFPQANRKRQTVRGPSLAKMQPGANPF